MKLIIVILRDQLEGAVSSALTGAGFRVTKIASTGHFWQAGVCTLLIGVETALLEQAIELVKKNIPHGKKNELQATLLVVPVSRSEQV